MHYDDILGKLRYLQMLSSDEGKPLYKATMVDGERYKLSESYIREASPYIIHDYVSESAILYAFGRKWKRPIKELVKMHKEMDDFFGGKKMRKTLVETLPAQAEDVCRDEHIEMMMEYVKKRKPIRKIL